MYQTIQCNISKNSRFEKMKVRGKERKLLNNNQYSESIKIVKSLADFCNVEIRSSTLKIMNNYMKN